MGIMLWKFPGCESRRYFIWAEMVVTLSFSEFNFGETHMGGFGSGVWPRIGCKAKTGERLAFDIRYWKRQDWLRCSRLTFSLGERCVARALTSLGVSYIREHTAEGLLYRGKLRLDFFLPDNKAAIEFHDPQHYRPIGWFGGRRGYDKQIDRDNMKRAWCKKNGVRLLEIDDIDRVESMVTSFVHQVAAWHILTHRGKSLRRSLSGGCRCKKLSTVRR